jgi:hypothetical protein
MVPELRFELETYQLRNCSDTLWVATFSMKDVKDE